MILSSVSGLELATFRVEDYQQIYHFPLPVNRMDTPLYTANNNANTRDILKHWVREPLKFRTTLNQIYKTKTLRKAYEFLVIFSCCLYGQESTETFPQGWVDMLDQLASEGKPFNWSDVLALELKVHVSNARSPPKDQQARFFMSSYLLDAIYACQ